MASDDRKTCVDICKKAEYLDTKAKPKKTCKPCLDSAGKMPTADRLACVCKPSFYKKSDDDTCFKCEAPGKPNADSTACIPPKKAKCPNKAEYWKDGACTPCPAGQLQGPKETEC